MKKGILPFLVVLGTLLSIWSPGYSPFFKFWSALAPVYMLGTLIVGFAGLIFGNRQLLIASWFSTGLLCYFLKNDGTFIPPKEGIDGVAAVADDEIRVGTLVINQKTAIQQRKLIHSLADKPDYDILVLQQHQTQLDANLHQQLCKEYPYQVLLNAPSSTNSIQIYSIWALEQLDTLSGFPGLGLSGCIRPEREGRCLNFVVSGLSNPGEKPIQYQTIHKHLRKVLHLAKGRQGPMITIGDYQLPNWYPDYAMFESEGLVNSYSGMRAYLNQLLRLPSESLYHNQFLDCTALEPIGSVNSGHLGVKAVYRFNERNYVLPTALD